MGMDIGGGFGAGGATLGLQQLLAQRQMMRAYADHQQQQQTENQFKQQQLDQQAQQQQLAQQQHQAALAETTYQHRQGEAAKSTEDAMKLGNEMLPGTFLPPDAPAVAKLNPLGLLKTQQERPSVNVGPLLPGDTGEARQQGFLKTASSKQQSDATQQDIRAQLADIAQQKANAGPKDPTPHFSPLAQYDEKGNPTAPMAFDALTGTARAIPGVGTNKTAPGAAQNAQHDRTIKETHDTLNQLDQAIDNAKDLIGPGQGRISNLEQMAGSADPRIQALGVKMKAAKMRVDHAVTGSVRAGASPVMMQQWDNILANKVTPEGLKAGVQAMREILGGDGASAGGKVEKWGRDAAGNLVKQ